MAIDIEYVTAASVSHREGGMPGPKGTPEPFQLTYFSDFAVKVTAVYAGVWARHIKYRKEEK